MTEGATQPHLGGSWAPLYIRTWPKYYFVLFYSSSATKYEKKLKLFIFAGCPLDVQGFEFFPKIQDLFSSPLLPQ